MFSEFISSLFKVIVKLCNYLICFVRLFGCLSSSGYFLQFACVTHIIKWEKCHLFFYSQDNWDDDDEDEEKKAEVTKTGKFLLNRPQPE